MTAAVATLATVQDAVVSIESRNEKVTAERIRAELGGGSQGTIVRYLAAIRSSAREVIADSDLLSPEIRRAALDLAQAIGKSQRSLAEEAFAEERRAHLETVAHMVGDAQRAGELLDATEGKLELANARLQEVEALLETKTRELVTKTRDYEELFGQFVQANSVIESLEGRLKDAEARPRDPMLGELATLMRDLTKRLEPVE